MAKKVYLDDYQEAEAPDAEAQPYADDSLAADVCPQCGELLAWHETACAAQPAPSPEPVAEPVSVPASSGLTFAYGLGQRVQPVLDNQAGAIVWRGQVKQRLSRSGLVHRVNVYRLDNGFWDCYYEEDLLAA